MSHESSLVNLSIPQSVTQPIVAAKIQEAVLAALGGQEKIVSSVIHTICNTKVNDSGNVSQYSSDNKHTWLDYHVTQVIKKEITDELKKQIAVGAEQIKEELVKQIQTKKGASKVASALIDSLTGTFSSNWKSSFDIQFKSAGND